MSFKTEREGTGQRPSRSVEDWLALLHGDLSADAANSTEQTVPIRSSAEGDGKGCGEVVLIAEEGEIARSVVVDIDIEMVRTVHGAKTESARVKSLRALRKQQVIVSIETIRCNEAADSGCCNSGNQIIARRIERRRQDA